jgi:hypothetical protein
LIVTTSFVTDIDVVEGAGGRVVVVVDELLVIAGAVVDGALDRGVGAARLPDGPELEHAAPNTSDTATSAAAGERVSGRSRG